MFLPNIVAGSILATLSPPVSAFWPFSLPTPSSSISPLSEPAPFNLSSTSNLIYSTNLTKRRVYGGEDPEKVEREGHERFCRWYPGRECADKDNCPEDKEYKGHKVQIFYSNWGVEKDNEKLGCSPHNCQYNHAVECGYELKGWLSEQCTNELLDWDCHHVETRLDMMGITVEFQAGRDTNPGVKPGCIENAFYGALLHAPDTISGENKRPEVERHIKCCNADDHKCLSEQPGSPFPPYHPPPPPPAPTPTVGPPPPEVPKPTVGPPPPEPPKSSTTVTETKVTTSTSVSTTTSTEISTTFITVTQTKEPDFTATPVPPEPPIHIPEPPPGDIPACPPTPIWCPWCQDRHAWPPEDKENWGPIGPDGKPCKESWPGGYW